MQTKIGRTVQEVDFVLILKECAHDDGIHHSFEPADDLTAQTSNYFQLELEHKKIQDCRTEYY